MTDLNRFTQYGNLTDFTKRLTMSEKWKKKKNSGNVLGKEAHPALASDHSTVKTSQKTKQKLMEENLLAIEQYKEQQETENRDDKLTEIRNKLQYGNKLNSDEKAYLRKKDPQAYQTVEKQEAEQKALEEKLKKAETKEEAQRVLQDNTMANYTKYQSVANDPNIGIGVKLAVYGEINQSIQRAKETFSEFAASGDYDRLPTEEEKRKAEQALREAEIAETEETAENRAEETQENRPEESPESLPETDTSAVRASKPGSDPPRKTAQTSGNKPENKRIQAENAPEALKVKQAEQRSRNRRPYHEDFDVSFFMGEG